MYDHDEVIATFIPNAQPLVSPDGEGPIATILVRSASGEFSLQPIDPDGTLGREALTTGAFRKGKPIYDPVSRRIMGYEMDAVDHPVTASRIHVTA